MLCDLATLLGSEGLRHGEVGGDSRSVITKWAGLLFLTAKNKAVMPAAVK